MLFNQISTEMILSHKELASRFSILPAHTLKESKEDARSHKKPNATCDTKWFVEYDSERQVVARYRSWISRSLKPPYKKQFGWERYSTCGALLAREVRYHQSKSMDYLH